MNVISVIAVHHLEDPNAFKVTVESFSKQTDVMIVTDTHGVDKDMLRKLLSSTSAYKYIEESGWLGPGAARNHGIKRAIELGYNCILLPDSHMRLLGDIRKLCIEASIYGFALGKDIDVSHFELLMNMPRRNTYWYGPIYNLSYTKYVEVYECIYKPWHMMPTITLSVTAIRKLMDIQGGYAILGWGYGAELQELSMSLSMLGYKGRCSNIEFMHRYNTGKEKFWQDRWNELQLKGFRNSFGVYMAKIVPKEYIVKSPYAYTVIEIEPWQKPLIENFKKYIRKTAIDIYTEFIRDHKKLEYSVLLS